MKYVLFYGKSILLNIFYGTFSLQIMFLNHFISSSSTI